MYISTNKAPKNQTDLYLYSENVVAVVPKCIGTDQSCFCSDMLAVHSCNIYVVHALRACHCRRKTDQCLDIYEQLLQHFHGSTVDFCCNLNHLQLFI